MYKRQHPKVDQQRGEARATPYYLRSYSGVGYSQLGLAPLHEKTDRFCFFVLVIAPIDHTVHPPFLFRSNDSHNGIASTPLCPGKHVAHPLLRGPPIPAHSVHATRRDRIPTTRLNLSQYPRSALRYLGVRSARRSQEEDLTHEEAPQVHGRQGFEGREEPQQVPGLRSTQARSLAVPALRQG